MDKNSFNSFENIMKVCGYSFDKDGNINYSSFNRDSYIGCNDITGGFQDIYPQLFVLVGEVIGAIVSEKLPINVQGSFGNWLQLIGQVILTYNAQQQYFEDGPGNYFNPKNYNMSNSFCSNEDYDNDKGVKNDSKKASKYKIKVKNLEKEIKFLKIQINNMKIELDNIKKLE